MDNRPGRLQKLAEIFREESINIRTMTIHDRGEPGIIKILVDKPDKRDIWFLPTRLCLRAQGVSGNHRRGQAGGFFEITEAFSKHGVNILDAHGFVVESSKKPSSASRSKSRKIKSLLEKEGIGFLEDEDLYQL